MAAISETDTPITRSLVTGTCVLITVWSAFICYRVQMASLDRGAGASYWTKHGPMSLAEKVKEIEDNPHMPPAAKRMAIADISAHMIGQQKK